MRSGRLPPLIVNVNGSLACTDSLVEALVVTVLRRPSSVVTLFSALLRGRAALKRLLAELQVYDPTNIPLREEVVQFLREEKENGRELHLATASDQSLANLIVARLGIFSSCEGTQDGLNLKGQAKLEHLQKRFPEGFTYLVTNLSDRLVWRAASSVVLVGTGPRGRRAAEKLGLPIEREIACPRPTLRHWLKAIRVHQWSKNLLLFAPLLLAHRYGEVGAFLQVMLGFLALSLIASGTYIFNDLSDLDTDRAHATKRNRPIASGNIGTGAALALAVALVGGGSILALELSTVFFGLTIVYMTLSLTYSLYLKRVPVLDVFVLGTLYTLRVLMGTVVLDIPTSSWLLVFSFFFFLSLSMAKRHVEIVRAAKSGASDDLIMGRGYKPSDVPFTLALGVSSSLVAILILFLYIVNDAWPIDAYRNPQFLWLIGMIVFLWSSRIWLLSHRGELHDDPVAFAVKDPYSWLLAAVTVVVFVLAVH